MFTELIKKLREQTGAGIIDCQKALKESNDDLAGAIDYLRKKGISKAAAKSERVANQGIIESYIHLGGKIGVLLELNCETDFVARTDEFKKLAHDIAMHIAAMSPLCVARENLDQKLIEKEKEIYKEQLRQEKKPDNMIEKIAEGKIEKYYAQVCLLEQPYIKDQTKNIKGIITDAVAKIGENIQVKRFVRFMLGEK